MIARSSLLALAVLLIATAGSAHAATATITGDAGTPVPLSDGMAQRHMSPEVTFSFSPEEARASVQIIGPAGTPASIGSSCIRTSLIGSERVRYQGNGAYVVILKISKNPDDSNCAEAVEQRMTFTINAFTAVLPPDEQPLLSRDPGSVSAIPYRVPLDLNPGADGYEFRYAANATVGPDGAIVGAAEQAFVDTSAGTAEVRFSKPGRYTFVARARAFGSSGAVFTAWSPRIDVTVVAPFDLVSRSFPDSRGPSYKLSATLREASATGKVTVSVAKGSKSKRFRRLGTAKIRKRKFTLRFRLRPGSYRLRYSYRGNATVARGTITDPIKITRRIF